MKTRCFDALLHFSGQGLAQPLSIRLVFQAITVPASFTIYEQIKGPKSGRCLARVCLRQLLSLKWKDRFEVEEKDAKRVLGKGIVLDPFSPKIKGTETEKRISFLRHLLGNERSMILALCQEKGIQGLKERELRDFCCLSAASLQLLSQDLEERGKIRILSFSPLFLLSQESFHFICQKIISFLSQYHQKHPEERGVTSERIERRFALPRQILRLALKSLAHEGKIRELGNLVALSSFELALMPEEQKIMERLEEMCFKGKLCSVSLKDIRLKFHLSPRKLEKLLSFLIERKKVVQGREGFFLHSRWLDDVISNIRELGKRELTVSDFKKMTGLSRKYAIPLLELLDEMQVTRRKGPSREIL